MFHHRCGALCDSPRGPCWARTAITVSLSCATVFDQVCVFGFAADPDAAVRTSFERAGAQAVFPKKLRALDMQMIREVVFAVE